MYLQKDKRRLFLCRRSKKSLISQRNRTVVIVSHNLKTLEELCDRVMWMHEGKIVKIGEPVEVLNEYREFMK